MGQVLQRHHLGARGDSYAFLVALGDEAWECGFLYVKQLVNHEVHLHIGWLSDNNSLGLHAAVILEQLVRGHDIIDGSVVITWLNKNKRFWLALFGGCGGAGFDCAWHFLEFGFGFSFYGKRS